MTWFQTALPPKTVCSYLKGSTLYQQQRDRIAALTHKGFSAWDRYQAMRPYLFAGGLLAAAAGAGMWYYRGFHHVEKGNSRIAEAHVIYPTFMAAGLALAYVTRPDGLLPGKEPRPTESSGTGFVHWLDGEVDTLRKKDPRFADKVAQRLINIPAVNHIWRQVPDHGRVFVECGRR